MSQPPGFVNPTKPTHVCRLQKSLYGLKKASQAWFKCLRDALVHFDFKPSYTNQSLFCYTHDSNHAFVLVYVDDLIVIGSTQAFVDSIITYLNSKFALKIMGDLSYFLGIEVHWDRHGLTLSQTKYI